MSLISLLLIGFGSSLFGGLSALLAFNIAVHGWWNFWCAMLQGAWNCRGRCSYHRAIALFSAQLRDQHLSMLAKPPAVPQKSVN